MATTQSESHTAAFTELWKFWAGALAAIAAAMYFMRKEKLIKFEGEWFYALIFFVAAAVLIGYGGYEYYNRTKRI